MIRRTDELKLFLTSNDTGKIYDSGYAAIEPVFIAHLNKLQDGNVLEIGAANGHTLKRLQESNPKGSIRYVLNEIDPLSQDYLRGNFSKIDGAAVTPALSTAPVLQHLRKNQRPYDAIYSSMVFHFFDPVQYLETLLKCHRNLKPGGQLFMIQNYYVFRVNDPGMIDFQTKKAEGCFFPGYYTSARAAGMNWYDAHNTMTHGKSTDEIAMGIFNPQYYPLLNFHDKDSLSHLLSSCGFEVELSQNCFETYADRKAVPYVGIIARKSDAPLDDDKIALIKNAARLQRDQATERYVAPYSTDNDALDFFNIRIPFIRDMGRV